MIKTIKEIPNWSKYYISTDGELYVRCKPHIGINGYGLVVLSNNSKRFSASIHRLVLETYVGPCPAGYQACHNDGDPTNNKLSNLRWDTPKNNIQDQIKHGTRLSGIRVGVAKLTDSKVEQIRELGPRYSQRRIAAMFGVTKSTITHVLSGVTWRHIPTGKVRTRRRTDVSSWAKKKLMTEEVQQIREAYSKGITQTELANRYGIRQSTVWSIVHRHIWKHCV